MTIHAYLQVLAIAFWLLAHTLIDFSPVLLPIVGGIAGLRALMRHRLAH